MRNTNYEHILTTQGCGFTYVESIALMDIDLLKGLRNQARLEKPIDDDLVADYATAMKAGAQFPPVVLWRPGRGRWIPVDGNQRLAAIGKCEKVTTDAYLLDTTDQMIADRISWTFNNAVNGKRLTKQECLHHAMTFVRKYGVSQEQAAREWGISPSTLRFATRAANLRDKLEKIEVANLNRLDDDRLSRISPLERLGDDVLSLGAAAVIENGLTQDQVNQMVADVGKARTHEKKIEAIVAFTKSEEAKVRCGETKGGTTKGKPLPRAELVKRMSALWRILEEYPATALRPTREAFKPAREKATDIVAKLTEVFGLGATMPKEETA